jgi:hypothetical protein
MCERFLLSLEFASDGIEPNPKPCTASTHRKHQDKQRTKTETQPSTEEGIAMVAASLDTPCIFSDRATSLL